MESAIQESAESDGLNALAMRLRRVTSRPPLACVEFLRPLSPAERLRYVEHCEHAGLSLFVDPIELETHIAPVLAQVRACADKLRQEGRFGHGMGTGGRVHAWIKSELARSHGIHWRTPQEMNPGVAFD